MKLNKNLTRILLMLFSVFIFMGSISSQNRLRINRQLQQSVTPYSIIMTDASNNQSYTVPGTEGYVLSIVGGIPTWVAGSFTDNIYTADGTLAGDRTVTLGTFDLEFDGQAGTNNVSFFTAPEIPYPFTVKSHAARIWDNNAGVAFYVNGLSNNVSAMWLGSWDGTGTEQGVVGNTFGSQLEFYAGDNMEMKLESGGALNLDAYGGGAITGTATFYLGVDVDGNVTEETITSGTLNAADNGVSVSGTTVQLGHPATGTGASDFTADRFNYTGAFDWQIETDDRVLMTFDATEDLISVGKAIVPKVTLHVFNNSMSGSAATGNYTYGELIVVENTFNSFTGAAMGMTSGDAGKGRLTFFNSTAREASFGYDNDNDRFEWANSGLSMYYNDDDSWDWLGYGTGTFNSGDQTYILASDGSGNIMETTTGADAQRFYFSTSTAQTDPGNGIMRFNAATGAATTRIIVDDLTIDVLAASSPSLLGDKIRITMSQRGDPLARFIFDVDGVWTADTGFSYFDVTFVAGAANQFDADSEIVWVLSPSVVGSSNTNFAEDNLTADADRTHTFASFDLTISTTGAADAFVIDGGTGAVRLGDYGGGSNTGTEAFNLTVDASGNVIETALAGGGTLTAADNGVSVSGTTVQLGHPATGTGVADFTANRYQFLGNFDYEIGTTGNASALYVDGSTGFVGIQNSSPNFNVDADGDFAGDYLMRIRNTNATGWGLKLRAGTDSGDPVLTAVDLAGADLFEILADGAIQAHSYGGGSITGTETFLLAVDVLGNVIETAIGGGDGNYAEDNLTADGIRSHTWTTFNQTETYTSGDYTIANTGAADAFILDGTTGAITLGDYGGGSNTGTAAFILGVDASGNVIEESISLSEDNIYTADGTLTADRTLETSTFDLLLGDIVGGEELALDIIQAGQIELRFFKGALNTEIGIDNSGDIGFLYLNVHDGSEDNTMIFSGDIWDHDMDDGSTNNISVTANVTSVDYTWVLTDGSNTNVFIINEDRTEIAGQYATSGDLSETLTANQDNWSPTGLGSVYMIRLEGDAGYTITGINSAFFTQGSRLCVCNVDTVDDFLFTHEDVSSTAANRFDLATDSDYNLTDGSCADFIYDQTSSRWRIIY